MDETAGANDTPAIADMQVYQRKIAPRARIATPETRNPAMAGSSKELPGESGDASAALGEAGIEDTIRACRRC